MDYREYIERNCDFVAFFGQDHREISAENISLLDALVGRRVKSSESGEGHIELIHDYRTATVLVRFDNLGETQFYNRVSEDLEFLQ